MTALPILLVEDSDADAEALVRVLERLRLPVRVHRCPSGACALDFLHQRGLHADQATAQRPAFILLDFHLPDMRGDEVLESIKAEASLRDIPVVAFSGARSAEHVRSMYQQGASSFVPKPQNVADLQSVAEKLMSYWLTLAVLPAGGPNG